MLDLRQILRMRKYSYEQIFTTSAGRAILEDLAKFCRAHETCFRGNEREHALLEGRREVWLRIQQHLKLNDEQLWAIYGRPTKEK